MSVERSGEESPPSVGESRAEGHQSYSLARGEFELKAEAAAHKRYLERTRLEHEQEESRKTNDQRRHQELVGFYVVIGIAVACLVAGFCLALLATDDVTRSFGQGVATLVLGGIVGGLAGYFTGQAGK